MLTNSLNEARAQAAAAQTVASVSNGQASDISQDTLSQMVQNTETLKELEAQLVSVVSFGGIQNSKKAEEDKKEYERLLQEAKDQAQRQIEDAQQAAKDQVAAIETEKESALEQAKVKQEKAIEQANSERQKAIEEMRKQTEQEIADKEKEVEDAENRVQQAQKYAEIEIQKVRAEMNKLQENGDEDLKDAQT